MSKSKEEIAQAFELVKNFEITGITNKINRLLLSASDKFKTQNNIDELLDDLDRITLLSQDLQELIKNG